jgi:hypothetical protein
VEEQIIARADAGRTRRDTGGGGDNDARSDDVVLAAAAAASAGRKMKQLGASSGRFWPGTGQSCCSFLLHVQSDTRVTKHDTIH